METVKLTDKGMEWAKCLETIPDPVQMVDNQFVPVDPEIGWNLADEVVSLLKTEMQVETVTSSNVAFKLRQHLEIPQAVLEEILLELVNLGFLEVSLCSADQELSWLVDMLRIVAHERRAKIILTISEKLVATSKELCEALGDIPVMTMRYHLEPLVKAGFVDAVNREGHIEYTLVLPLLKAIGRRYNRRFCRD